MPLTLYPEPVGDEKDVRVLAREIINKKLKPFAVDDDEKHFFRREVFNECAKLGLTSLMVPKKYGGQEKSARAHYAFIEETCRSSMAIGVAVGVTNLVQGALVAFGSDEQKQKYLSRMITGELLGAFSLSEPGSGSDAAGLCCAAQKTKDGYKINGNKVWCSNAGIADLYLLMARTGEDKVKGISAFLIPRETKGFRVGKLEKKLGLWSSTLAELIFEDCLIPESLRLGKEGEGFSIALSQLDGGRIGIAACGIGVALEALERVSSMPQPEGVQHRLATHLAYLQAAKSLLWEVADRKDRGEKITLGAAEVKMLASDLAMQITSDAVEFMGEYGYTRGGEVERMMRDAKALQIVEGTNQIQRIVIAREIRKMCGVTS
jgi:alkylation response protein AidB-like acyl-CoA dehydrogenase